jgi:hypothetical protein
VLFARRACKAVFVQRAVCLSGVETFVIRLLFANIFEMLHDEVEIFVIYFFAWKTKLFSVLKSIFLT